jgi:hypothetical protein
MGDTEKSILRLGESGNSAEEVIEKIQKSKTNACIHAIDKH